MNNIIYLLSLSFIFGNNIVFAQNFISSNSSFAISTFNIESSSLLSSSSSISTSSLPSTLATTSSSSSILVAPTLTSSNTTSSFNLFTTSINTNVSSSISLLNTTSTSSTPIITSNNISTLPITSTSKSSLSSSSSFSESKSSTSFTPTSSSTSSITPTTSKSLSTYTSNGQVMVTQVFMTLTSTHTSFSTKPGKHHGLSNKNKKIVAGVVVGVGVPFIILIVWLIYFFMLKGKKQRYIDSQGREVIDVKHNKFVRYIWCDLLGFSFKDDADQSMYNNSNSSFRNSNNFMNRGGSKNSSNHNHMNNNLGVLGNNVMQMNDIRLEKENALLKEQREKGFPTNDNLDDKDHMDSSNTPLSLQENSGRDIDGNFKGRNSLNTHRRMESVVTGDGFDYLDEINAKKY
ncbi:hypothetical protein ACO0R3_000459 [Hanseniaspora guilliermondii]